MYIDLNHYSTQREIEFWNEWDLKGPACGARNSPSLIRSPNFDRCALSDFLHPPPAAVVLQAHSLLRRSWIGQNSPQLKKKHRPNGLCFFFWLRRWDLNLTTSGTGLFASQARTRFRHRRNGPRRTRFQSNNMSSFICRVLGSNKEDRKAQIRFVSKRKELGTPFGVPSSFGCGGGI